MNWLCCVYRMFYYREKLIYNCVVLFKVGYDQEVCNEIMSMQIFDEDAIFLLLTFVVMIAIDLL